MSGKSTESVSEGLLTCYLMEWQDASHFQFCNSGQTIPGDGSEGGVPAVHRTGESNARAANCATRTNLLAKIVSFQPEVM